MEPSAWEDIDGGLQLPGGNPRLETCIGFDELLAPTAGLSPVVSLSSVFVLSSSRIRFMGPWNYP